MPLLATELLPIDLTALVASTLGMMVVIIPVLGLTIRFAARPLVEALRSAGVIGTPALAQGGAASTRDLELLARRVVELEQEVARLKGLPARGEAPVDPLAAGAPLAGEGQRLR
jgi:hypothetical protein